MFTNAFRAKKQCSQVGESLCSTDADCMQSCPYGDIPASRMACNGSPVNKYHGQGKCRPAWSKVDDACEVGADSCLPSENGYNDLYCQQKQLEWSNYAPGFQQNWVGDGTCQRRTLPATKVGAVSWQPGVRHADYAYAPVDCTDLYVDRLRAQGLLQCSNPGEARRIASHTCSNVLAATCQNNQVIMGLK